MAEGERFELSVGRPTTVFKTAAINHSATPPYFGGLSLVFFGFRRNRRFGPSLRYVRLRFATTPRPLYNHSATPPYFGGLSLVFFGFCRNRRFGPSLRYDSKTALPTPFLSGADGRYFLILNEKSSVLFKCVF